jgi:hypothetical protein
LGRQKDLCKTFGYGYKLGKTPRRKNREGSTNVGCNGGRAWCEAMKKLRQFLPFVLLACAATWSVWAYYHEATWVAYIPCLAAVLLAFDLD